MTKIIFDKCFAICMMFLLLVPMLVIAILVKLTSKGPALHWSERVGQNSNIFLMPKFRTMHAGTPQVATHLINDPAQYVTPFGRLLRKFSLDELPQLWSIFAGDMSVVGPRPALFNQKDLISLRKKKGIDALKPGLTGLAQVSGRDDLELDEKVDYDLDYLNRQSLRLDIQLILATAGVVLKRSGISH